MKALILFLTLPVLAQFPDTDIYVADLTTDKGVITLGTPENVTKRTGYDNQPHFEKGTDNLLYSSIREDGQSDIYRLNLKTGVQTRLTQTSESEYSPTITPDGGAFSVIQVEADGTQRLHRFKLGETLKSDTILDRVKAVGYHHWISPDELALFLLGEKFTLVRAATADQKVTTVAADVGRCIARIPNTDQLSFVHKRSPKDWQLCSLDLKTNKVTDLVKTRAGSEDYVWMADGSLLMGEKSTLYHWSAAKGWTRIADLKKAGMPDFYRIALNGDQTKLALVTYNGERP